MDSAVLYVTQDSPKHSTDAEEVVKQAFAPEARDPAAALLSRHLARGLIFLIHSLSQLRHRPALTHSSKMLG